jgi:hypothetical protein
VNPVPRLAEEARLPPPGTPESGASVVELVVAVAVAASLAGTAFATMAGSRDALAGAGAARYLAARVHKARAAALARGAHVALVFWGSASDLCYGLVVDGNRNGVRTADIASGIDRQVEPCERLGDHFAGVTFGIEPGVTEPESATPIAGSPLRLGGSTALSFGPDGGATSGTVYFRNRTGQQFALRVLGATGRSRALRFDARGRRWDAL